MKFWIIWVSAWMLSQSALTQGAVVFALGTFNSSNGEFEQESNTSNDSKFYVHAGDYRNVEGVTGFGAEVLQSERLSDGPTATDWSKTMEGFRRALIFTPGFQKEDVFFQLTPEQAQAESLLFRIRFNQIGSGSTHDLQFTFNGQVFATMNQLTAATDILEFNLDASVFEYGAGGNVIGLNRTGGSNSWITMDALELHSVPEPSAVLLSMLGCVVLVWRRRR